ncbi:MAG: organomercurial lyase [bacterium]
MAGTLDLDQLADKLVGAVPRFDPSGRRVAVGLYRMLSEGAPVQVGRLTAALDLSDDAVHAALDGCSIFYDDQGAVVGFGGLTVVEMPPHRLIVDWQTLYTWCAWDSLFIPAILGKTAQVESVCPVTRSPVSMLVSHAGVLDVTPATAVVSFLTPNRRFDQNVIANFCHFVHFFQSTEVGVEWTAQHPGTFLLSVEEAFILGQLTNARNFGEALEMKVAQGG